MKIDREWALEQVLGTSDRFDRRDYDADDTRYYVDGREVDENNLGDYFEEEVNEKLAATQEDIAYIFKGFFESEYGGESTGRYGVCDWWQELLGQNPGSTGREFTQEQGNVTAAVYPSYAQVRDNNMLILHLEKDGHILKCGKLGALIDEMIGCATGIDTTGTWVIKCGDMIVAAMSTDF